MDFLRIFDMQVDFFEKVINQQHRQGWWVVVSEIKKFTKFEDLEFFKNFLNVRPMMLVVSQRHPPTPFDRRVLKISRAKTSCIKNTRGRKYHLHF